MAFDVKGALAEGYSPTEIADHLAKSNKFDLLGARKEGYSDLEIIDHLSKSKTGGVGESLVGGIKRNISSIRTGVSAPFGANEAATAGLERQAKITERPGGSLEEVKRKYRDEGILSAAGEAISQVPSVIAEQAPFIGEMIVGGRAGAAFTPPVLPIVGPLAKPIGAVVGAAVAPFLSQAGSNVERQASEQINQGKPVDVSAGRAFAAAAPQALLDVAGMELGLGRMLGISKRALGTNAAETLAREKLLPSIIKGTGKTALAELPTEVAQQMLERAQAGLSLTDKEAMQEYSDVAYQAALMSPLGGVSRRMEVGDAGRKVTEDRDAKLAAINAERARQANIADEAQAQYAAASAAQQAIIDSQIKAAPNRSLIDIINEVTGVSAEPAGNTRQGFNKALNEPSGRFVSDPETGLERELTVGEMHEQQYPELFAEEPPPPMLALPSPKMVSYPNGVNAYPHVVQEYISSLPEEERIAARAELLGYVPEPADVPPALGLPRPTAETYAHYPEQLVQFKDGSTATVRDFEAHLTSLPEDQRMQLQAKVLGYAPQAVPKVPGIVTPKEIPVQKLINQNLGIGKKPYTSTPEAVNEALSEPTGARVQKAGQLERPETEFDVLKRDNPETFGENKLTSLPSLDKAVLSSMGFVDGKAGYKPLLKLGKDPIGNADKIEDLFDTHLKSNKTLNKDAIAEYRSKVDAIRKTETGGVSAKPRATGAPIESSVPILEQRGERDAEGAASTAIADVGNDRVLASELGAGETSKPVALVEEAPVAQPAPVVQEAPTVTKATLKAHDDALEKAYDLRLGEVTKNQVKSFADRLVRHGIIDEKQRESYAAILRDKNTEAEDILSELETDVEINKERLQKGPKVESAKVDTSTKEGAIKAAIDEFKSAYKKQGRFAYDTSINLERIYKDSYNQNISNGWDAADAHRISMDKVKSRAEFEGHGNWFGGGGPFNRQKNNGMSKMQEKILERLKANPAISKERGANNRQSEYDEISQSLARKAAEESYKELENKMLGRTEQARGRTEGGHTADTLRSELTKEFGVQGIKSLENRGILNIHDSVNEAPEYIRNAVESDAIGAHSEGVTHLFADRIAIGEGRRGLLHEVGEHYGLKGMLGESVYNNVLDTIAKNARKDPVIKEAIDHVARNYPELQGNQAQFNREVVARIGESAPTHTLYRRIVAGVKNFLVKMGLMKNLSASDIQDLIQHSLRTAMKRDIEAPKRGVEGAKYQGEWAGLSEKRMNSLINEGIYHGNGNEHRTRMWIAQVDPRKFVEATTTTAEDVKEIEKEAGKLNLTKLRDEGQTPYIYIDDGEVTGHEGRHRMMALANAGITRVPIVVRQRGEATNKYRNDIMELKGQEFYGSGRGKPLTVYNAIPLNMEERNAARQEYTKANELRTLEFNKSQTATPAFKNWFGDSKVVNEDGSPKVVYHGTDVKDFNKFKPSESGLLGPGIYTTDKIDEADSYGGVFSAGKEGYKVADRGRIIPVYVSLKNPFYSEVGYDVPLNWQKQGYDGVIWNNKRDGKVWYVAADSKQIKSAVGNKGTFNPKDARIEMAKGPAKGDLFEQTAEFVPPEVGKKDSMLDVVKNFDTNRISSENLGNFVTDTRIKVVYSGAGIEDELTRAYEGAVSNALTKEVRADILMSQALSSNKLGAESAMDGKVVFDDNGVAKVVDDANNLNAVFEKLAALSTKIGADKARHAAQAYLVALRYQSWLAMNKEKDIAIASAKAAKKYNLAEKIKRQKKLVTEAQEDAIPAGLEFGNVYPEVKEIASIYNAAKNNEIDMLEKAGYYSKDLADEYRKTKGYVPLFRVMDDIEDSAPGAKQYFRGFSDIGAEKKATGSSRQVDDVFDNMMTRHMWAVNAAVRNRANRAVANQLGIVGSDGELKLTDKPVDGAENSSAPVWIDGERKYVQYSDPKFAQGIQGLEPALGPLMSIFAGASQVLRMGVTMLPPFQLAMVFHDAPRAALNSGVERPFQLMGKVVKSFATILKDPNDPFVLEMKRLGITGGYGHTAKEVSSKLRRDLGLEANTMVQKALDKAEVFAAASDMAQRRAIYMQTMEETGNQVLAMHRALDIINFQKHGASAKVRALTQVVPFMNAYLQGMDVLYKAMSGKGITGKEKRQAQVLFIQTAIKLAALSALYSMLVADDEDYKKLDDREKVRSIIIPGTGVKIPVAPDVAMLVKTIPELGYQYMVRSSTNNPMDATKLFTGISDSFKDGLLGPNLMPQVIRSGIEVAVNKSFVTGNPIVGRGLENLETSQQFTENTSRLARLIGQTGIISPMNADHLMKGYGGTAASLFLYTTDGLVNQVADVKTPATPIYRVPSINAFFYSTQGKGQLNDYYDMKDRSDEVTATLNNYRKYGTREDALAYAKDNKEILSVRSQMNALSNRMKTMREIRKEIVAGNLDATAKREKLDEIDTRIAEMVSRIGQIRIRAGL